MSKLFDAHVGLRKTLRQAQQRTLQAEEDHRQALLALNAHYALQPQLYNAALGARLKTCETFLRNARLSEKELARRLHAQSRSWAQVYGPRNEEVRSPEELEELCKTATPSKLCTPDEVYHRGFTCSKQCGRCRLNGMPECRILPGVKACAGCLDKGTSCSFALPAEQYGHLLQIPTTRHEQVTRSTASAEFPLQPVGSATKSATRSAVSGVPAKKQPPGKGGTVSASPSVPSRDAARATSAVLQASPEGTRPPRAVIGAASPAPRRNPTRGTRPTPTALTVDLQYRLQPEWERVEKIGVLTEEQQSNLKHPALGAVATSDPRLTSSLASATATSSKEAQEESRPIASAISRPSTTSSLSSLSTESSLAEHSDHKPAERRRSLAPSPSPVADSAPSCLPASAPSSVPSSSVDLPVTLRSTLSPLEDLAHAPSLVATSVLASRKAPSWKVDNPRIPPTPASTTNPQASLVSPRRSATSPQTNSATKQTGAPRVPSSETSLHEPVEERWKPRFWVARSSPPLDYLSDQPMGPGQAAFSATTGTSQSSNKRSDPQHSGSSRLGGRNTPAPEGPAGDTRPPRAHLPVVSGALNREDNQIYTKYKRVRHRSPDCEEPASLEPAQGDLPDWQRATSTRDGFVPLGISAWHPGAPYHPGFSTQTSSSTQEPVSGHQSSRKGKGKARANVSPAPPDDSAPPAAQPPANTVRTSTSGTATRREPVERDPASAYTPAQRQAQGSTFFSTGLPAPVTGSFSVRAPAAPSPSERNSPAELALHRCNAPFQHALSLAHDVCRTSTKQKNTLGQLGRDFATALKEGNVWRVHGVLHQVHGMVLGAGDDEARAEIEEYRKEIEHVLMMSRGR